MEPAEASEKLRNQLLVLSAFTTCYDTYKVCAATRMMVSSGDNRCICNLAFCFKACSENTSEETCRTNWHVGVQ